MIILYPPLRTLGLATQVRPTPAVHMMDSRDRYVMRGVGRVTGWTTAEAGNWQLRQHAATRNDAKTWLGLDRHRQRQSWSRYSMGTAHEGALPRAGGEACRTCGPNDRTGDGVKRWRDDHSGTSGSCWRRLRGT